MTVYVYPNFKTKKALREAVASGQKVTAEELKPWGAEKAHGDLVAVSGPHFPEPHKWYAVCLIEDGNVMRVLS